MVQMFNNDPDEVKFFNIGKALVDGLNDNIDEWFENAYRSADLGKILWSNRLDPLASFLDWGTYKDVFYLFEALNENLQSIDLIYDLIQELLGESEVKFTYTAPDALHIYIRIIGTNAYYWFVERNTDNPKQPDQRNYVLGDGEYSSDRIVFDDSRVRLTREQLRWIFNRIVFQGCYVAMTIEE